MAKSLGNNVVKKAVACLWNDDEQEPASEWVDGELAGFTQLDVKFSTSKHFVCTAGCVTHLLIIYKDSCKLFGMFEISGMAE